MAVMARILNTIPDFQRFAGDALDDDAVTRQQRWKREYRDVHPEVFEAFFAGHGDPSGVPATLGRLLGLRQRAQSAASTLPGLIERIEPQVSEVLGTADEAEPLHVLLVGTFSTNAFVAPLGDDLAVFHCVEWFTDPEPAGVLVAHEDAHAWHRHRVTAPEAPDLAWEALYEGLAVAASRTAVPDRPDDDYFWYGLAGFEDWLPWCREHRDLLLEEFRDRLDDPDAVEAFFGAGFVHEHWRTGLFVADLVIEALDTPLDELVGLDAEAGRQAVIDAVEGLTAS